MATALLDKTSLASGIVDPALHARIELGRYATGLKRGENFVVMVEGGVTRTPGTKFVMALKNEAQKGLLMPFEFSVDDAYQLVFNAATMRVLWNGGVVETSPGVPYELTTAVFTEAVLPKMRWAQSGDLIFIAWGGQPKVLTRRDHTDWTLTDYGNLRGPVEPQNTDKTKTIYASGDAGTGITLTASSAVFQAGHVGSTWRLDEGTLANIPRWKGNETGLSAGNLRRNGGKVYSVVSGADAGPNPPTHDEGDVLSGQGNVVWRYEHSGVGYVKITGVSSGTVATGDVVGTKLPSDVVGSGNATYRWYEPAWSDVKGWPTTVLLDDNAIFWFRGNKYWRGKASDFYDFDITAEDDSAIAGLLTSPDGRLVDIQWALNVGVIGLGGRAGEWTLRAGGEPTAPMTLQNVRPIPGGTEGSAPHRPQAVDGGAVYIGRSRKRLHFAEFDAISEKLPQQELTLYARNLLRGAAEIAYQRDPHRILWIRQDDGQLISVSWRPDQEVIGWMKHPKVNGAVEAISVVTSPDATYSELSLIVRRTIDGQTRRYVEVMQPFFEPIDPNAPTAIGAWFVDSGLRYQGAPTKNVSGLAHLKGQEVAILANGIQHRRKTVSATGTLTLDRSASDILVGLPIVARVRPLPFETKTETGSTKGSAKSAEGVWVERLYSAGGEVSINDGEPDELLLTGQEKPPAAQPLVSGGKLIQPEGPDNDDMTLEIELLCDNVYPFTLLGLSPYADIEAGV